MSRTKKDILNTEAMLTHLLNLLLQHRDLGVNTETGFPSLVARDDAESLRRISMTLHRWHELECGDSNDHGSWMIVRGKKDAGGAFEYDDDGSPYLERHSYRWMRDGTTGKQVNHTTTSYTRIPDREAGARKRLANILRRYPGLQAYVQTDPRGCALYILQQFDVPAGGDVSAYYSRGLAVYQ